jgi:hypothetical protein
MPSAGFEPLIIMYKRSKRVSNSDRMVCGRLTLLIVICNRHREVNTRVFLDLETAVKVSLVTLQVTDINCIYLKVLFCFVLFCKIYCFPKCFCYTLSYGSVWLNMVITLLPRNAKSNILLSKMLLLYSQLWVCLTKHGNYIASKKGEGKYRNFITPQLSNVHYSKQKKNVP